MVSDSVETSRGSSKAPQIRFSGKRAIVTGAASGIGRATVLRLVAEGATVLGVDKDEGGLHETADLAGQSTSHGNSVLVAAGSVLDQQFVHQTIEQFSAPAGGFDVLVNMAGILRFSKIEDTTLEQFMEVLSVNLGGAFLVSREAIRYLEPKGGCIVNAASTSALFGHPYVIAYSASKGAIISMTRSMAWEYMRRGIRVNAVAPGAIATPMQSGQVGFPEGADLTLFDHLTLSGNTGGQADDVAGVIAMLASDDGRHINGEVIRIDGGLHS